MPIFDHEAPAARGVTGKDQSVAPWAISRLSPWYGWEAGAPGIWNLGTRRHAIRERPWQLTSRR